MLAYEERFPAFVYIPRPLRAFVQIFSVRAVHLCRDNSRLIMHYRVTLTTLLLTAFTPLIHAENYHTLSLGGMYSHGRCRYPTSFPAEPMRRTGGRSSARIALAGHRRARAAFVPQTCLLPANPTGALARL